MEKKSTENGKKLWKNAENFEADPNTTHKNVRTNKPVEAVFNIRNIGTEFNTKTAKTMLFTSKSTENLDIYCSIPQPETTSTSNMTPKVSKLARCEKRTCLNGLVSSTMSLAPAIMVDSKMNFKNEIGQVLDQNKKSQPHEMRKVFSRSISDTEKGGKRSSFRVMSDNLSHKKWKSTEMVNVNSFFFIILQTCLQNVGLQI